MKQETTDVALELEEDGGAVGWAETDEFCYEELHENISILHHIHNKNLHTFEYLFCAKA